MPLLRINATPSDLALHDTSTGLRRRLRALAAAPGPVVIMVHGYKYAPASPDHCPHRKLFGEAEHSWPAALGFKGVHPAEGLAIAFGWYARGSLRSVHQRAAQLGTQLAHVIARLKTHAPQRPVHIIAHSMGSEAALSALAHLPTGAVDRMVLLTGASYANRASKLLETPAGRSARVLNVTSRENDLFDAAFERLVKPEHPGDHAIGRGIRAQNAVTLQLDCQQTITGLHQIGLPISPRSKRICHWSAYKRPGVMQLYARFLRDPEILRLAQLKAILPETPAPRWSRLLQMPGQIRIPQDFDLSHRTHQVGSGVRLPNATCLRSDKNEPAY
ncbi:alpha/beta hydrolase [Roseobacter denitrificans]|uniref:Uncharacterized protein n=1 Tax=Roseobacter denitrificans (strain ATCC 33942 / OCh 114) TaxID=375451 RepID=Q168P7_ROSDO|nr:alpha/beta hydrolase [Roseobacter denitrificans]ABG31546.1 hypothetical protein RD1_1938 [Roseobacter denitrificans OCh 114]AVL54543.1 alpha/beta hydrolase [Roseobacter denitrificans]SFF90110.1 Alpha/beta hydrolase of unknown function [Roseobacter denitrificans OCh 114]